MPAHLYFSGRGTARRAPQLIATAWPLADDVEDLQVAYFHDADGDGDCDANEWRGGDCPAAGGKASTATG